MEWNQNQECPSKKPGKEESFIGNEMFSEIDSDTIVCKLKDKVQLKFPHPPSK